MSRYIHWIGGAALCILGFIGCHDSTDGARTVAFKQIASERPYLGKWQASDIRVRAIHASTHGLDTQLLERMAQGVADRIKLEIFRDYSYRSQFFDQTDVGTYRVYGDGRYLHLLGGMQPALEKIDLEINDSQDTLLLQLPAAYSPLEVGLETLMLDCKMTRAH